MTVLAEAEWRLSREAHRRRLAPHVQPRLRRRRVGARHPVDDFLFDYYRFRPGELLSWHPGAGDILAGDLAPEHARYVAVAGGHRADPSGIDRRRSRIEHGLAVLRGTAGREPGFSCFGMHEWAMVLDVPADRLRHAPVALRVGGATVRRTVTDVGLRCTHFDAYRFFAPGAAGRQRALTPGDRLVAEQPGCIHAAMDLYRYAFQAAPYVPSDLVADCFLFARRCREVDMRASPYDLSAWDVAPIPVETAAGRREYADLQRSIAADSAPIRQRVIAALTDVLAPAVAD